MFSGFHLRDHEGTQYYKSLKRGFFEKSMINAFLHTKSATKKQMNKCIAKINRRPDPNLESPDKRPILTHLARENSS